MVSAGRSFWLVLLVLGALAVRAQDASLTAEVDRETIRANESFHYILRAEGRISGRPDLSALERDFEFIDSRSSSRLQIINGRRSEVIEWILELMPRRAGEIEIPAAEIGGVLSNTVRLEVLPAPTGGSGSGDIFMEVELDRGAGYVQAQVIYTLRLFIGIPTGRTTLTRPLIQGGETIIEDLRDDREYQTRRGDRDYQVYERRYAIFPQAAGTLSIGPSTFEATVEPSRGNFSRVERLQSDVLELEVRPAVAPPASHPDAVWLPARDLRLEQTLGDAASFTQGVPRTRTLTVIADGLLETQLPELEVPDAAGLRQYPDQPGLFREVSADGIEARRVERYAVIAQQNGTLELPGVELPWWNVDAEHWEIARVEARAVRVLPGNDAAAPTPQAPPAGVATGRREEPPENVWVLVSALLAAGWAATIAAWIMRARVVERARRAGARTRAPSSRMLVRQLKAACRVDDAGRAQSLLLDWARLQFPDDPPVSLGKLADRLGGPLADEVRVLEAALYGRGDRRWSGSRLAELVQGTRAVSRGSGEDDDPLVPLYR